MNCYLKHLPPLNTLIFFEAVVRNGSFTKAATELFVTQSAVSKQIRALEDSLNVTLFERRSSGIVLTAAGENLYAETSLLLEKLLRTVTRLRAVHDINTITVACTHAVAQYWLFPRLVAFSELHPAITVNIHASNDIDESNVCDHDFGILYGLGNWSSLSSDMLFPEVVHAICSAQLGIEPITSAKQLSRMPLIQLNSSAWNCINWHHWFKHFGLDYAPADGALMFNQVTLAFNAVQAGMGIGLGWDFMARDLIEKGELVLLGELSFATGYSDFLVHARGKSLSNAAETFRTWLTESALVAQLDREHVA